MFAWLLEVSTEVAANLFNSEFVGIRFKISVLQDIIFWVLNYKWNALYFLLSHHVSPSVQCIIVVCQRGATNCSEACWGRLLFCGSWRIAFIKTQLQPPSGAVNRESSEGLGWRRGGVEPSLGTCLSRSSPALVWPRWRITEAGGPPPHTCVPLGETLMIIGRHHQACTQEEGPRQWCCEGETDALIWKGEVWCFPAEEQDERNSHSPWKLHCQTLQWGAVVAETLLCFGTWGEGKGWNRLAAVHRGNKKKESRA